MYGKKGAVGSAASTQPRGASTRIEDNSTKKFLFPPPTQQIDSETEEFDFTSLDLDSVLPPESPLPDPHPVQSVKLTDTPDKPTTRFISFVEDSPVRGKTNSFPGTAANLTSDTAETVTELKRQILELKSALDRDKMQEDRQQPGNVKSAEQLFESSLETEQLLEENAQLRLILNSVMKEKAQFSILQEENRLLKQEISNLTGNFSEKSRIESLESDLNAANSRISE